MIRHTSHVLAEVVIGVALLAVLALGAAAWRLSQGPVSLSFLSPYFDEALNPPGAAYRIDFSDTILTWAGWERALDVAIVDVRVSGRGGGPRIEIPQVAVALSARALFAGRIAPTRLDVARPTIPLRRAADGRLRLDLGDGEATLSAASLLGPLWSEAGRSGAARSLREVRVTGAELRLVDEASATRWLARDADLTLRREGPAIRAEIAASLVLEKRAPRVTAAAVLRPGAGQTAVAVTVDGLVPADLAGRVPGLEPLAAFGVPLAGKGRVLLDAAGRFVSASGRLSGGAGRLHLPGYPEEGLAVAGLSFEGSVNAAPAQLVADRLSVDLGGPRLTASGVANLVGSVATLNADLTVADLPAAELGRLWPRGAAAGGRRWVLRNITAGVLSEGRASLFGRINFAGAPSFSVDAVDGGFRIEEATIHYLRPMPPAVGAAGSARFTAQGMDFTVERGGVEGLKVSEGRIHIGPFDGADSRLDLELVVRGPVADALALLDHPRLRLVSRYGIDPASVSGLAATRLAMGFPLLDTLSADEIDVRAASNLSGVALAAAFRGVGFDGGAFSLKLDSEALRIGGKATVGGAPAELFWQENFDPAAPVLRRYAVTARLDDALRRRLGVDVEPEVEGPVAVALDYRERRAAPALLTARLGLDEATLRLPVAGWRKEAGVPGVALLDAAVADGRLAEIRDLDLRTEGLRFAGRLVFDRADGGLQRAEVRELALAGNVLSGTAARRADGGFDVSVSGPVLDAGPLVERLGGAPPGAGGAKLPPFTLEASVQRLAVTRKAALSDALLTAAYDGERLRTLDLAGGIGGDGGDGRVELSLVRDHGRQVLSGRATDGGAAIAALGLSDAVRGGVFTLAASRPDQAGAPWSGRAKLERFHLVRAPMLARLLTLASFNGVRDALAGKGIAFRELTLPFEADGDRIKVNEARAVGSQLGLTASGTIERTAETVEMTGTIIPAYSLNSLPGKLPVLGPIITGGESGGGVFAATFRLSGPLDEPTIRVNPLAALAPGVLREIFGVFDGRDMTPSQADEPLTPESLE